MLSDGAAKAFDVAQVRRTTCTPPLIFAGVFTDAKRLSASWMAPLTSCGKEQVLAAALHQVHEKHRMHEVLADKDGSQAEGDRAQNSKVQRPVLEVIRSGVHREDHVEHEEVVEAEHPLQHISAHPHVGSALALVAPLPTPQGFCRPKEPV